ncbi:MAG TPA: PhzF family phenazine biosynthesis protein [Blastocatellia bacterium]|nr:PhzF family phenazine biosynthesis protein [Blastocatellia bacterium]HMV82586.1 PhzF family phenazine biosynthesis protein [Blastocatellia bacterium]HMX29949.1 PhzF family phenazine biosynthesis protein [Blastocatellia bacterium]HMZ18044.1 PhzF family phenazine biosynthesis protein [Blastocatellia bacterium]
MSKTNAYRYRVVDVFTRQPLEGNALAVFTDAAGLDGATMQKIARELNLSETVFISPATRADCAVSVRIFTPMSEMIFAGHPTIGASFVLLDEGIVPKDSEHFVLEEKIGPVPIRVERGERPLIWLTTPPIHAGKTFEPKLCAQALGLTPDDLLGVVPQIFSAGNPTLYIALKDQAAVDRAWFDMQGVRALDLGGESVCVFVFTPTHAGAYSRMFAPEHGVVEDPATGSATGPLAAYMLQHGLVPSADGTRFISEQGAKMGRRSFLHVQLHGEGGADGIEVGGYVTPLVEATMRF